MWNCMNIWIDKKNSENLVVNDIDKYYSNLEEGKIT